MELEELAREAERHKQELRQAEETQRFLSDATALIASSLDYEQTLESVARLAVPRLADFCLVDILGESGEIKRMVVAHQEPAMEERWREMQRRFPLDPDSPYTIPKVLRTGEPEIYKEPGEELLRAALKDEGHIQMLLSFGLKSSMIVPLIARGRTLGAISFISAESGHIYDETDLAYVQHLARRAALAIDNARLYREAREANRVKDEFLATLSHELRTPLTPVIGWIHMLRGGHLSTEETAHGLSVIEKNSERLTRIINDLLDMSAIMSGKMHLERESISFSEAVREAVETLRLEAASRNIRFELNTCPEPINIKGDRTRLVQVFWNLIHNAVKFSGKGGRVSVRCESDEREARFVVEDEGAGIAPEFLPHVFERFRQADSSTTRLHGGLGIGLALVKSFVEAHGGSVSAESEGRGRGSRFTVSLPREQDEMAASKAATPSAEQDERTKALRVLVIEDAEDTLEMLGRVFEARGLRAMLCASSADALDRARTGEFDLIVSDIGLPEMDGLELIRRLREMPHMKHIPAIAFTGYAAQKDIDATLAAGYGAHISKPIDPQELLAQIEALLRPSSNRAH